MRRSAVQVLVASWVLLLICGVAGASASSQVRSDLQVIWSAVWSSYVDPFFGGVDWHRVPDRIHPQLEATTSEDEAYAILAGMLAELDDSQTHLIPPAARETGDGESRRLRAQLVVDDGIALLRLEAMTLPVLTEAAVALRRLGPVEGMILDLRGVPGIEPPGAASVAAWFLGRSDFGAFEARSDRFVLEPSTGAVQLYGGPLVVLIDEATQGTAEIVALLLGESERATLMGRPTLGGFAHSVEIELPSGWGLSLTVARYQSPGGRTLHDQGVQPDVELPPPEEGIDEERDLWRERAIAWLRATATL